MHEPPRIATEQQYRVVRDAASQLRAAIDKAQTSPPDRGVHPRVHMAGIETMRTQLEDLERQLREYETRGPRRDLRAVDGVTTVRCSACRRDVEAPRHEPWLIHGTGQYVPALVAFICPHCENEIRIAR